MSNSITRDLLRLKQEIKDAEAAIAKERGKTDVYKEAFLEYNCTNHNKLKELIRITNTELDETVQKIDTYLVKLEEKIQNANQ